MRIIRANIKDALSIFEIEKNNFTTDTWTVSQWENEFKDNKFSIIYLLKDKEEVIGYIDFWIMFEQATIAKHGNFNGVTYSLAYICPAK